MMLVKTCKHLIVSLLFTTLVISFIHSDQAQATPPNSYVMVPTENSLTFQAISDQGTVESEISLSGFAIAGLGNADWTIPSPVELEISPNGRYVAFTAFQDEDNIAVFIFDFEMDTLTQIDRPNLVNIRWSPASDAILMKQLLNDFSLPFPDPVPPAYLYDLNTQQITQVTQTSSNHVNLPRWIDNDSFVFSGFGLPCELPCRERNDLFLTDRYSTNELPLTNLGESLPVEAYRGICSSTWSPYHERVYFEVGCNSNLPEQALYSTDLNGNTQLEIAFADVSPNALEFATRSPQFAPNGDIYMAYFAVESGVSEFWVVLKLDNQGNVSKIYERIHVENPLPGTFLQNAFLSPTTQYMALAGNSMKNEPYDGGLIVIDTTTGNTIFESPSNTMDVACTMRWLDEQTIIYDQVQAFTCNSRGKYKGTYTLDVTTGNITPLVEGNGSPVFMLPVPVYYNLTPTANAGTDQTISTLSNTASITLDGSGSSDVDGSIVSYVWKDSTGTQVATGVSPTVDLPVGVHTLTLTVTDDDGATASDEVVITVEQDFAPSADAGADQTVNTLNSTVAVSLNGSGSSDADGTISSYIWTKDGSQIATGTSPNVNLGIGVHSITLTVTDNDGYTSTDTVEITINQHFAPNANAGADQTVVTTGTSKSVTLNGTASTDSDGTIASYVWKKGSNQIATGASPNVTLAVGAHTITLTVTDNHGYTDTDTVVITVVRRYPPSANAGPDQTVVTTGTSKSVILNGTASIDSDGTIASYVWKKDSNQIATGASPNVTLAVGTHTITLTVTDNHGYTDTDTVVITVVRRYPPSANAGPDQTVVTTGTSKSVTLNGTASTDSDGTIASYVWKKGSNQIATGASPNVTLAVGTHTITLTVTDNHGYTDTDTVVITVHRKPSANAGPDQTKAVKAASASVTLNGSGSTDTDGSITSYVWKKWDYNSNTYVSFANGATKSTTLALGTHKFQLTVTDNHGYTDTDEVIVHVTSWITFSSERYGNSDIFMVDPNNAGTLTRLTTSGYDDFTPAWSPDRTKIAWSRTNASGDQDIWVMNVNNPASATMLSNINTTDDEVQPDWSPDGQKLVFVRQKDTKADIFTTTVSYANGTFSSTSPVKLTENSPYFDLHPDWSPDGTQIAFDSDRDGTKEVYVMSATLGIDSSRPPTQLTSHPIFHSRQPVWSPNGKYLAFSSNRSNDTYRHIYVIKSNQAENTTTNTPVNLTQGHNGHNVFIAWSPDSIDTDLKIVFVDRDESPYSIYILTATPVNGNLTPSSVDSIVKPGWNSPTANDDEPDW